MSLSPAAILYDSSGNPISIISDGGVYRVSGITKVLDSTGAQINPATEDTLQLSDARLTTIDAVLDSIKDTDGIKKITDALPTGDNIIGRARLVDGSGNLITSYLDGSDYRVGVDSDDEFIRDRNKVVGADFYKSSIGAGPSYFLGIDLSNGGTKYKHSAGSKIIIVGAEGTVLKSSTGAAWDVLHGVILSYSDPNATIAWLRIGSMHARGTNALSEDFSTKNFPVLVNLEVSAGDLINIAAGYKETSVNIGSTVEDLFGDNQVPAVGDSIIKVERTSGGGTAEVHISFWYYVE